MNIKMKICGACGEFHYTTEISCPHCESRQHKSTTTISKAALLLGLGLTACDRLGPEPMPLYGAPFDTSDLLIDEDGDGYNVEEDCDDTDSDIYPGAEETPEDGIDSNCNNDDDT